MYAGIQDCLVLYVEAGRSLLLPRLLSLVSILCISCCTSGSLIPNSTGYLSFPGSANHGMGSRASMGWRVHGSLCTARFGIIGMVHVGLLHQHGWTLQQEEVQVRRL